MAVESIDSCRLECSINPVVEIDLTVLGLRSGLPAVMPDALIGTRLVTEPLDGIVHGNVGFELTIKIAA